MNRSHAIQAQFIFSPIFDSNEELNTAPFTFNTDELSQQAPTKENYKNAKKIGMLMMLINLNGLDPVIL